MIRFVRFTFILSVLFAGMSVGRAQRPQGTSTNIFEIVSVGQDLVALALPESQGTRVLHSTDGGETYAGVHEVQTQDELKGLGVNGDVVLAVGTAGLVRRADFSVDPSVWTDRSTAAVIGDVNAAAAGAGGVWVITGEKTFRSSDNGLTWSEVDDAFDVQNDVVQAGTDIWLTAGGVGVPSLRRSVDDGLTWNDVTLPLDAQGVRALGVDGAGTILAVGEGGTVLLSTDQGVSFSVVEEINVSEDVNDVFSTGVDEWVLGLEGGSLVGLQTGALAEASILFEQAVGSDSNVTAIVEKDGAVVMAGTESVAAPLISGDPANFINPNGPVEITLTSSNPVYFTLDGSAPDGNEALYSLPFVVGSDLTVKAVAEAGGVFSAVTSREVTATSVLALSMVLDGADLKIDTDTSALGTSVQLQANTDLMNASGWTDVQAPQPGANGTALQWTVTPIPTVPTFWRVVVE